MYLKHLTRGIKMDKRIEQLWNSGQTAVCGWLLLPDALTAEIMANQGYDTVTIDLQHGLIDYQTALSMLQAMNEVLGLLYLANARTLADQPVWEIRN